MKQDVVVVTGASAGVGRAIVRELGRRRAHVGLLARGIEGLEATKREIEAAGGEAWSFRPTSATPRRSNAPPNRSRQRSARSTS